MSSLTNENIWKRPTTIASRQTPRLYRAAMFYLVICMWDRKNWADPFKCIYILLPATAHRYTHKILAIQTWNS